MIPDMPYGNKVVISSNTWAHKSSVKTHFPLANQPFERQKRGNCSGTSVQGACGEASMRAVGRRNGPGIFLFPTPKRAMASGATTRRYPGWEAGVEGMPPLTLRRGRRDWRRSSEDNGADARTFGQRTTCTGRLMRSSEPCALVEHRPSAPRINRAPSLLGYRSAPSPANPVPSRMRTAGNTE